MSGVSSLGEFFLERGANLESPAAHTHPKIPKYPPGLQESTPATRLIPPATQATYRLNESKLLKSIQLIYMTALWEPKEWMPWLRVKFPTPPGHKWWSNASCFPGEGGCWSLMNQSAHKRQGQQDFTQPVIISLDNNLRVEASPRNPPSCLSSPYPKTAVGKGGHDGKFLKLGSSLKLTVYQRLSKLSAEL